MKKMLHEATNLENKKGCLCRKIPISIESIHKSHMNNHKTLDVYDTLCRFSFSLGWG